MGSIKIGFAGAYKCDLLLYFSRILNAAEKKVAIVDASEEQLLAYSVPTTQNDQIITYRDVDIFLGCQEKETYEQLELNEYYAVFIDFGYNKKLVSYMNECNEKIVVSNLEKQNVLKLKEFLKEFAVAGFVAAAPVEEKTDDNTVSKTKTNGNTKVEVIKIYRDIVKSKIDTKYLDTLLGINELVNVIGEYIYYFDPEEYRCRIESQYNDIFKFNKLSKYHKMMLSEIIQEFLYIKEKNIKRAIKRAERGL